MKENSIEEIIKQLELILKVRKEQKEIIECAGESCINCDPDIKVLTESIKIVSDYKRALKENEILKEEKEQAWEEWNNLEQGSYKTEQKLKQQIKKLQKENEEIKSENRRLKVIRYSTEYGTENIHLITKSDLVQIDINKYMIEIEEGKFIDLKQVYQENIKLKNNIRKNENELEFDANCDWITLQKILDESEKSAEYILYKNEKWIKEKYCIPVQKVKDKIEELSKTKGDLATHIAVSERIRSLQEILEESEDSKDGEG